MPPKPQPPSIWSKQSKCDVGNGAAAEPVGSHRICCPSQGNVEATATTNSSGMGHPQPGWLRDPTPVAGPSMRPNWPFTLVEPNWVHPESWQSWSTTQRWLFLSRWEKQKALVSKAHSDIHTRVLKHILSQLDRITHHLDTVKARASEASWP